jgi:hypothetical protein
MNAAINEQQAEWIRPKAQIFEKHVREGQLGKEGPKKTHLEK